MNRLELHIDEIQRLCRENGISTLFAFGSVTRNDFNDQSDIDLLVDIPDSDPLIYSDKYFTLKFSLEKMLGRKIDLLESKALNNPVLKEKINKTRKLIYGRGY